jgi:hypothetical protein
MANAHRDLTRLPSYMKKCGEHMLELVQGQPLEPRCFELILQSIQLAAQKLWEIWANIFRMSLPPGTNGCEAKGMRWSILQVPFTWSVPF